MIYLILKMKLKKVICLLFLFLSMLLFYKIYINVEDPVDIETLPRLIWWTPFTFRNQLEVIQCGSHKCAVTDNRKYFNNSLLQAILFYASNFEPYDLPPSRDGSDIWALIHEESPKNIGLLLHEDALNVFNYSSTFSSFSDFPLTLQYLPSLDLLTSTKYFVSTVDKNNKLKEIAPVLYIQSDCQTPLERDSYVLELMKYIKIDSYGKCLNNKKLPEKLTVNPLENLYDDDFMKFVAQYKFVIAFENAICDDYITEKLWRPLIVGSVPIYLGSPTVKYWLPNYEKSAIIVKDFKSPKVLAEYINKLNNKNFEYENYLQHKLSDIFRLTNENLKLRMKNRKWTFDGNPHFHTKFECFLCKRLHEKKYKYRMERKEYNCPIPVSPLTNKINQSNWWNEHWTDGKCQAKILKDLVYNNIRITKEEYEKEFLKLKENRYC